MMAKWFKIQSKAELNAKPWFIRVEDDTMTSPPGHDASLFLWEAWPNEPTEDDLIAIAFAGRPEDEAVWREEKRLGQLTIRGRHLLAVKQAKMELIEDMEAEGVINPAAAARMKAKANPNRVGN